MKKLKTLFLVTVFATLTFAALSQGDSGVVTDTGVVADTVVAIETGSGSGGIDPLGIFGSLFVSITALAAGVTLVTGWITTHSKGAASIGKQNVSWLVGIGLGAAGHYLELGAFGSLSWYWSMGNGLLAGFVSNSYANIEWVKIALRALAAKAKIK